MNLYGIVITCSWHINAQSGGWSHQKEWHWQRPGNTCVGTVNSTVQRERGWGRKAGRLPRDVRREGGTGREEDSRIVVCKGIPYDRWGNKSGFTEYP
ncbi:hypothetical protein AGOR_G00199950 [Albula goreensis]|uniref:Uncharacterized protein n=1 Tax=Albula goreensis TaxID=1534307 RepID=A0A8T3CSA0_9TELE|nr:hypothetical protein AGOR_G00199950 [Albula goreensis]